MTSDERRHLERAARTGRDDRGSRLSGGRSTGRASIGGELAASRRGRRPASCARGRRPRTPTLLAECSRSSAPSRRWFAAHRAHSTSVSAGDWPTSGHGRPASVLPRWTTTASRAGQHDDVLALVAVGGERSRLVRPGPPVAAVAEARSPGRWRSSSGPGRPSPPAAAARRRRIRRAGTARRSGRTGGPARRRTTSRPSCRRSSKRGSASAMPTGPNRRWSRKARVAASRAAGSAACRR